jgi:hypothetical protein
MTRKALARRIAEPYLTSQQGREAPSPPQPEGLRGFWPGALLLVSQRPQRVFSFLAPRTQTKFAAALLYEPQTWCTSTTAAFDPLFVSFNRSFPHLFRIISCRQLPILE